MTNTNTEKDVHQDGNPFRGLAYCILFDAVIVGVVAWIILAFK